MPRIPEAELERLKREISLERLAEAAGVILKRHGQDRIGLCPFHDDHEPRSCGWKAGGDARLWFVNQVLTVP